MKKVLTLFALLALVISLNAQKATAILGKWSTENGKSVVEIYQQNGVFYGKMIELKNPIDPDTGKPKLDKENPEAKLKSRPLLGLVIMTGIKFESDNYWGGGDIYDPESGNTYSCRLKMNGNDQIDMRGYMGFSLIGRSTIWTRKK
ncbi:MAG: DUF2147 domain-containing protein [Bacteroidales bacterium]|nr:DUF2147 domain-containing protein [Bacteroidales bacterium]